jgi:hypothetical protein
MGIIPLVGLFVLVISAVTPRSRHLIGNRGQINGDRGSILQAHTYVDLPLDQVINRIPVLKGLQPADENGLRTILEKVGHSMDEFTHDLSDLIADEDLTQQKLKSGGKIKAKQRTQDDYLIAA